MLARRWNNPVRRVLDLSMYLVLCFMIGTGVVMWLRLPRGSGHEGGGFRGGRGGGGGAGEAEAVGGAAELMGLNRHEWGDWHLYAGLTMIALGIVHLWLNRAWLTKIASQHHSWRLWTGLGVGAAVVLTLAFWPLGG